jgi:2-phosphosulfolactate phosphatase
MDLPRLSCGGEGRTSLEGQPSEQAQSPSRTTLRPIGSDQGSDPKQSLHHVERSLPQRGASTTFAMWMSADSLLAGQRVALIAAGDLALLASTCEVVVVIDVLRFTSCVSVACSRGAIVLPYEWGDDGVETYAAANDAFVPGKERASGQWTLSPSDMREIPPGTRVVLPSPNGSALSFRAAGLGRSVIAGCLRNADAVAIRLADSLLAGQRVALIAAGEGWAKDGVQSTSSPLRPALEDLLGAGAIIDRLAARFDRDLRDIASPESLAARAAFVEAAPYLKERISRCGSGRELHDRGWHDDVETCSSLDEDHHVPMLSDGAFR